MTDETTLLVAVAIWFMVVRTIGKLALTNSLASGRRPLEAYRPASLEAAFHALAIGVRALPTAGAMALSVATTIPPDTPSASSAGAAAPAALTMFQSHPPALARNGPAAIAAFRPAPITPPMVPIIGRSLVRRPPRMVEVNLRANESPELLPAADDASPVDLTNLPLESLSLPFTA